MRSATMLVLLTGHPCTGKSTLARALTAALALPVFAKDDFQETLFDADPPEIAAGGAAPTANLAALGAARRTLLAGLHCGVDANLDSSRWTAPVSLLLAETGSRLLQVRCSAHGTLLVQRFAARAGSRHPGHRDRERLAALRARLLGPPLAPLEVPGEVLEYRSDRADPVALAALVEHVGRRLGRQVPA